jgi:hypothetical protein
MSQRNSSSRLGLEILEDRTSLSASPMPTETLMNLAEKARSLSLLQSTVQRADLGNMNSVASLGDVRSLGALAFHDALDDESSFLPLHQSLVSTFLQRLVENTPPVPELRVGLAGFATTADNSAGEIYRFVLPTSGRMFVGMASGEAARGFAVFDAAFRSIAQSQAEGIVQFNVEADHTYFIEINTTTTAREYEMLFGLVFGEPGTSPSNSVPRAAFVAQETRGGSVVGIDARVPLESPASSTFLSANTNSLTSFIVISPPGFIAGSPHRQRTEVVSDAVVPFDLGSVSEQLTALSSDRTINLAVEACDMFFSGALFSRRAAEIALHALLPEAADSSVARFLAGYVRGVAEGVMVAASTAGSVMDPLPHIAEPEQLPSASCDFEIQIALEAQTPEDPSAGVNVEDQTEASQAVLHPVVWLFVGAGVCLVSRAWRGPAPQDSGDIVVQLRIDCESSRHGGA